MLPSTCWIPTRSGKTRREAPSATSHSPSTVDHSSTSSCVAFPELVRESTALGSTYCNDRPHREYSGCDWISPTSAALLLVKGASDLSVRPFYSTMVKIFHAYLHPTKFPTAIFLFDFRSAVFFLPSYNSSESSIPTNGSCPLHPGLCDGTTVR